MKWVLFLDDNEDRIEVAKRHFGKIGQSHLLIARTASQAIDFLAKATFDLVHLDHDLGGEVFVDSDREDCGMEVVRWMVENRPNVKEVVVHSWNIPAAGKMFAKLSQAGYAVKSEPFSV
ncbi:MAG: hypothetical protein KIT08_01430 [Anaerolineales bacterium]|nr:MAG: hypothetical protein KIT08_01430 [Anaerolineales bacterium]